MNKCPNCGNEFEGKFCPNCGVKWEEEKTCPKCGTKLSGVARFCNECGYSFVANSDAPIQQNKRIAKTSSQTELKQKIFSAFRFIPFAVFALFSILLFAFYSAPVAELVLGMGMPNENLGNVYSMYSGLLSEIPEVEGAMITLIVIAAVSFAYACLMGVILFVPKLKFKEINVFGKRRLPVSALMGYISFIFYLIFFVIGIAIMGTISSVDEGMGILVSGSCPILLLVFSLIFALLSVGSFVGRYLLAKTSPELMENESRQKEQYLESEKLRKERFYATHSAPIAPIMGTDLKKYKRESVVYKHAKRKYDKANESQTSAVIIWLDLHKVVLAAVAFLLAVAIILVSVLVPIFTNKFRISVVEKIQLGYTHEQVEQILGTPYEATSTDTSWQYYDDSYTSLLDKIQKNGQEQERAFENGNENALFKLAAEEAKLKEQLSDATYCYIEIQFTNDMEKGYVASSIFFDANRCDNNLSTGKELKDVKLSAQNAVGYYVDESGAEVQKKLIGYEEGADLYYSAYYNDGAFYRTYLINGITQIDGQIATTTWSDKFASYEITNQAIKIGSLDADGVWTSTYEDIESVTLPESVIMLGDDAFKNCTKLIRIVLPEGLKSIGDNAFSGCSNLVTVIMPDSVESIGTDAFAGCYKLQYEVEGGLNYLGKWLICVADKSITTATVREETVGICAGAFNECKNLANLTIPFIGATLNADDEGNKYPFGYIFGTKQYEGGDSAGNYYIPTALKNVTVLGGEISYEAFFNCRNIVSIIAPNNVIKIGENAFYGCSSLANFIIPEGVTEIGNSAFYGCSSLANFIIPEGVTEIGNSAFYGCSSLNSIAIPKSVVAIGDSAFRDCGDFSELTIPVSVTRIGYNAFNKIVTVYCEVSSKPAQWSSSWCNSSAEVLWGYRNVTDDETFDYVIHDGNIYLTNYKGEATEVEVPAQIDELPVVSVGTIFQGNRDITRVVLPSSITVLNGTFYDCRGLESVVIPNGLMNIGDYAFYECYNLKSVTLPNTIVEIGRYAFYGCEALLSVNIPNGVVTIGDYSFYDCRELTTLIVPSSVRTVGEAAFSYCYKLSNITLSNGVVTIGDGAFASTAITNIHIPESVVAIGESAFSGCDSLVSVTIPDNVVTIGGYAFNGCDNLASVIVGKGVKSIGDRAFYGCAITQIFIPQNVVIIGSNAVSSTIILVEVQNRPANWVETWSLGTVVWNSTGETSISAEGFSIANLNDNTVAVIGYIGDETDLVIPSQLAEKDVSLIFLRGSNITSISLPQTVKIIGAYAFYGCSELINVSLPNSIIEIGEYAFYNCRSLENITLSENLKIIGDRTFCGCRSLINIVIPDSVSNIRSYAFSGCSALETITLGKGVTLINHFAFENCNNLSALYYSGSIADWCNIEFNDGGIVRGYEANPLYFAHNLYINNQLVTELTIPDGIKSIKQFSFSGGSFTSLTLPNSVERIGDDAFYGCSDLKTIIISANNPHFGIQDGVLYEKGQWYEYNPNTDEYHEYEGLVEIALVPEGLEGAITIPDGVSRLGYHFENCAKLTSITFGRSLYSSGYGSGNIDYGFFNSALEEIIVPSTNEEFSSQDGILYNKDKTEIILIPYSIRGHITIPDTITEIPNNAFYNCPNLESVTIGSGVTTIGKYAFYNCTNLQSVTIGRNVSTIGTEAFRNCTKLIEVYNLSSLLIKAGSSDYGYVGYYALGVYDSVQESKTVTTSDGFVFFVDGETITLIDYVGTSTVVVLPDNYQENTYTIHSNAFYNKTNITSLTIGTGVTRIGSSAFANCTALTTIYYNAIECGNLVYGIFANAGRDSDGITVTIGNKVKIIPDELFGFYTFNSQIARITSVVFEENSICESIGGGAFWYCSYLTSIEIPNSVQSIGSSAFRYCSGLRSVTIGRNVTSIGIYAFERCSALESVVFDNPNGWQYSRSSSSSSGTMVASDLSDSNTAAKYLVGSGATYYLKRYDSEDLEVE